MKKNLHLFLSAIIVVPAALTYGLTPNKALSALFDFNVATTDLHNIFRAVMGLYLGMATLWTIGILKPRYWAAATLSNIAFMGGLALGRLISLLADGIPSIYFTLGMLAEAGFAVWGWLNWKKCHLKDVI
jgi:Domain of unknown function (DUF4345)